MKNLSYLNWIKRSTTCLKSSDGINIEVYEFCHCVDDNILSEWATHFRQQYCDDYIIDKIKAPNQTRKEYLLDLKFPDKSEKPGPSIRSGDFAEIMISDFLEYVEDYWVPRTRYNNKTIRNESTKGSDVIGLKMENPDVYSKLDSLFIVEVKAGFSNKKVNYSRLQDAVNDSGKDYIRKAESLNAMKQRFLDSPIECTIIERFQQEVDYPYSENYGAVGMFDNLVFVPKEIEKTDCSSHKQKNKLKLLVIKGADMLNLIGALYDRAANEA